MQMAAGAVRMVQIVGDHADSLAFRDVAAVQDPVGVHRGRIHVHVAEADVFGARVDLQRGGLLPCWAYHHAVADGGDGLPVRLAAVGAFAVRRTCRGPNILALMAKSAGALSDAETARFAKIILPRVIVGAAGPLVG